jgi:hypothetical protein
MLSRVFLVALFLAVGLGIGPAQQADPTIPSPQRLPPGTRIEVPGERKRSEAPPGYCQALASISNGAALVQACEFSTSLRYIMPDYLCTETLKPVQFTDIKNNAPELQIMAEVRLQNGEETYSDVRVNGKPANIDVTKLAFSSMGEFSSLLRALFHPQNAAQFSFGKEVRLHSTPAWIFDFTVHQQSNKSLWFLRSGGHTYYPGYRGSLWLEKASSRLMRLEMNAIEMQEANIPFKRFKLTGEYAYTALGDGTSFVLPTQTSTIGCANNEICVGSSVTFANCHKFAAKSRIVPTPESP